MQIRRLTEDDTDAMRRQFTEAFGAFDPPEPPVPIHAPGKHWWGVEVDGALVATALDRAYDSWFGGAKVPTAGIGGVTVSPEHRGTGLLADLLRTLHDGARERGAVVSTLYATSPGIYRRLGYETVASLDDVRLPTASLALGGSTAVRRATADDADAVRAVHERVVAREHGPLSRTGDLFAEPPTLRVDGVSVAHRDGEVVGYTSWDRGRGYGASGELRVWDVVADDPDALRSLLTMLSHFDSVTPTTLLRTSGRGGWQHLLRTAHPTPVSSTPYALAVLDPRALAHLPVPAGLGARLPFVVGDQSYALVLDEGSATVEQGDGSGRRLTAGGLALTFAGAQTSAQLRQLDHLAGDATHDEHWDLLFCRGPVTVHDYF